MSEPFTPTPESQKAWRTEQAPADPATARAEVTGVVEQVRQIWSDLGAESLHDGSWFGHLLHRALRSYTEKVDTAWLRARYPDLPMDAIADRRIALAQQYTALASGTSASAYSAAMVATIGSGGGASPVAVPAGVAAFGVDLMTSTLFQLRLAYDLSVVYEHPVDLSDPEDLFDLLRVAFGVKAGDAFQQAAVKLGPEATRVAARGVFAGTRLAWVQALPVVGKFLLQRNLIKFAIPVVNIPLAAGLGWFFAGQTGRAAARVFRVRAKNVAAARRVADLTGEVDTDLVLRVMWIVVREDGEVTRDEALLVQHVAEALREGESGVDAVKRLRAQVDLPVETVLRDVAERPPEEKTAIWEVALRAAEGDGHVHRRERALLHRLADACGRRFDPAEAKGLET